MTVPCRIQVWAPTLSVDGGGIAAFSRELVHALRGERTDLSIVEKPSGVRMMTGRGSRLISGLSFAVSALRSAWQRRPAVIICTHPNFGPLAVLARRLLGIPFVLVAHGIDIHEGLSVGRRRAIAQADGLWAVSRWTRGRLMDLGADARVIRVIGNTVDDVRFSPGPALPSLREKYGLADDTRVILTVARLSAAEGYKGYDTIIRVLPQVKQVIPRLRYLLVGQGDDLPRLEHLAHEIGVAADVSFCGFVADSDLADHYRLADIFAMPSRGEGFGIVFLEALACGTLVIGGSIDGARDALDDGHLGELVDPACDNAISSALISALETASMRNFADRASLRARMLARHGRAAFREKVFGALAALG